MAFRFPLATVLRVKEIIEKREEVALQKAQLEIARAGRKIQELTDQIGAANAAREEELHKAMKASRLHLVQREIDSANEAKQAMITTMKSLRQQRDAQMKRYQIARSEREMFTDLREQQKTAYENEQIRVQQKRLDDIVAARWQRS
jgi:flagellar export protein FliJ